LLKEERGDLLMDHKILNTWKNYFCQLLNIQAGGVRQTETETAEVEVAIGKFKIYDARC
jgi:hypothetical protein